MNGILDIDILSDGGCIVAAVRYRISSDNQRVAIIIIHHICIRRLNFSHQVAVGNSQTSSLQLSHRRVSRGKGVGASRVCKDSDVG